MIKLENISKTYRVPIRDAGVKAAIQSFFNRKYREIEALKDMSFEIPKGQIVGYIGPNGAGKSTTIKIMTGILRPDEGTCQIDGLDPFQNRKEHTQHIGVIFGQRTQLWWDIPVIDSFELLRDIYEIPQEEYELRLEELSNILNLKPLLNMATRQLSLGQRMRCDIAAALIHDPKILFLDEPTIGLDASSKVAVRNFIKRINQKYQTTIILTTHDMQDIESLVDRILLIGKGELLFDGTMEKLKASFPLKKSLKLKYQGHLEASKHYDIRTQKEDYADLIINGDIKDVLDTLNRTVSIEDIEIINPSLDDVILKIYEDLGL